MNLDKQWRHRVRLISIWIFIICTSSCDCWQQTLTFTQQLSYNTSHQHRLLPSEMKFFMWYNSYAIYGAREKLILLKPTSSVSGLNYFAYSYRYHLDGNLFLQLVYRSAHHGRMSTRMEYQSQSKTIFELKKKIVFLRINVTTILFMFEYYPTVQSWMFIVRTHIDRWFVHSIFMPCHLSMKIFLHVIHIHPWIPNVLM
jgi:hypothetical protein